MKWIILSFFNRVTATWNNSLSVFGTHSMKLIWERTFLKWANPSHVLELTGNMLCIYWSEVLLLNIVCVGWRPFPKVFVKIPRNQLWNCPWFGSVLPPGILNEDAFTFPSNYQSKSSVFLLCTIPLTSGNNGLLVITLDCGAADQRFALKQRKNVLVNYVSVMAWKRLMLHRFQAWGVL